MKMLVTAIETNSFSGITFLPAAIGSQLSQRALCLSETHTGKGVVRSHQILIRRVACYS